MDSYQTEDCSPNVDKISKTFVEILRVPTLTSATYDENEETLNVCTEWSYYDVSRKERLSFVKMFTMTKSSLKDESSPVVLQSTPIPYNSKMTVFSTCGSKKAILINSTKQIDSVGDGKDEILQIFNRDFLLKSYDMKELDKHKNIYTSGAWGCTMIFSKDCTKLAYLAEKKIVKAKPYFSSYSKLVTDWNSTVELGTEKKQNEDIIGDSGKGQEFAYRQSWGEQLSDAFESIIAILDIEKDEFRILPLPDNIFPYDLQWVDNSSIIASAYPYSEWKLGAIFCSNRESRIFQVKIDGSDFKYLSDPGIAAFSPRVRPDSKFVVWQERLLTGNHRSAHRIIGCDLQTMEKKIVYDFNPPHKIPLYTEFPINCWTHDGKQLWLLTDHEIESKLVILKYKHDELKFYDPFRNIQKILWIGKDYVLASRSSLCMASSLLMFDLRTTPLKCHTLSDDVVQNHLVTMKRLIVAGSVSPPSFYYGPTTIQPKSIPLIVMPHGGPHGVYVDAYAAELEMFLQLGFGILRCNYIGSTGGKVDVTESLLGKAGDLDVKDCQNTVVSLLKMEPSINHNKIVLFGGSHGGFLCAHLSSKYPEYYKAVILLNPVTDLSTMVGTTDIPDWCYAEAGVDYDPKMPFLIPTIQSSENALKLINASPIRNVDKVEAPTLLHLGSEDLRVPMSQGLSYYRALKAANKIAEVRMYNDCHSLMKPQVRFDVFMQSVLWFMKYLK